MQIKMWAKGYPTYFLTLIFLFNCFSIKAQSNFAPVGATWYHSGYDKNNQIFKTVAYKDTIILGQNCRELKQTLYFSKPLSYPYMHFYHASRNLYVYGTEDTVFIYNEVYKRFTPLYIFNVKVGDTVRLPYILPINCPYVMSDTNDASLGYVVDSVKDVNYDGQLLKTVYSTVLKTKHSYFGWGGTKNVFVQKIGSPNFGLLPTCLYNCAYTTGEDVCPYLDSIICYHDKDYSIKFRDTCLPSTWVPASINEKTTNTQKLDIYPNPQTIKSALVLN